MRDFFSISLPLPVLVMGCALLASSDLHSATPTLNLPTTVDVALGVPLHLPLTATDADGDPLSFSIAVSNGAALETFVPTGNRSLELNVTDFGTMTFELFEARAPITTGRIIELAESGFYDDIIFHRTIDEFVIQAGDPTGTGAGGSDLPDFDDEFHVDLLHSGRGILSMAKADDDTNDSQFFVAEVATPFLDFNHSVFGVLTSGEDVRDAISNGAVDFRDRPIQEARIESARIFADEQNGVLMLKALEAVSGDSPLTVSVTASDGTDSVTSTFDVNIVDDTFNRPPFLESFPAVLETGMNQTLTFQLAGIDIEGDAVIFDSFAADPAVEHNISDEGLLTVVPPEDFLGELEMAVAVFPDDPFSRAFDRQFFSVSVVPEPSSGMLAGFCSLLLLTIRGSRLRSNLEVASHQSRSDDSR